LYAFGDWCSGTSLRGHNDPLNRSQVRIHAPWAKGKELALFFALKGKIYFLDKPPRNRSSPRSRRMYQLSLVVLLVHIDLAALEGRPGHTGATLDTTAGDSGWQVSVGVAGARHAAGDRSTVSHRWDVSRHIWSANRRFEVVQECQWPDHAECTRPRSKHGVQRRLSIRQPRPGATVFYFSDSDSDGVNLLLQVSYDFDEDCADVECFFNGVLAAKSTICTFGVIDMAVPWHTSLASHDNLSWRCTAFEQGDDGSRFNMIETTSIFSLIALDAPPQHLQHLRHPHLHPATCRSEPDARESQIGQVYRQAVRTSLWSGLLRTRKPPSLNSQEGRVELLERFRQWLLFQEVVGWWWVVLVVEVVVSLIIQ